MDSKSADDSGAIPPTAPPQDDCKICHLPRAARCHDISASFPGSFHEFTEGTYSSDRGTPEPTPPDEWTDAEFLRNVVTRALMPKEAERVREIAAKLSASGLPAEPPTEILRLERWLDKATIRLEICRDRFEGCAEGNPLKHAVSLLELPAWIEEQREALRDHLATREPGRLPVGATEDATVTPEADVVPQPLLGRCRGSNTPHPRNPACKEWEAATVTRESISGPDALVGLIRDLRKAQSVAGEYVRREEDRQALAWFQRATDAENVIHGRFAELRSRVEELTTAATVLLSAKDAMRHWFNDTSAPSSNGNALSGTLLAAEEALRDLLRADAPEGS